MNIFIIILVLSFQTLIAQATLPTTNDEKSFITNKAFELVYKQSETLNLIGQIRAEDNLKAIFKDAGTYLSNVFGRLLSMGSSTEEDDEPTSVNDLVFECNKSESEVSQANCSMNITYKAGDKVELRFGVLLNSNPDAAKDEKLSATVVINNQVSITHTAAPQN